MRNILLHKYGRVDLPTVFQVATVHLPTLMVQVQAILRADKPPITP